MTQDKEYLIAKVILQTKMVIKSQPNVSLKTELKSRGLNE